MSIETLFENDDYVVINKPVGVMVHSDGKTTKETISDWFSKKYPESISVGEKLLLQNGNEIQKPGVVHRLDKDTSGVLVLAKRQQSFAHLKEQFKKRLVNKTYVAFVYGLVKYDDGEIDRPIGRSSKDFRLKSAQRGAKGTLREAQTKYKVLIRGNEHTKLELNPKTGRTHQIRTHLKAVNHPIICDSLYAPKRECALGFERLALHAKKIEFRGLNGENIVVEASEPKDFELAKTAL
jgi:23S rRNA pseudouridine1911/1915/1917 synthase